MKKKQGTRPKAAAEKKPAPPQPWWEKLSTHPRRVMIFSGAAVAFVILIIVILVFGSPRKEAPPKTPSITPPQAVDLSRGPGGFHERPLEQPAPRPRRAVAPEEDERPTIKSIRLHPLQPTRKDTLKAEVVAGTPPDPTSHITYSYLWKVNNRPVEGATGDTLNLSTFKKRDLVTVTVTPYDSENAGFSRESAVVTIYAIPPSLDLKDPRQPRKGANPLEFQLVSLHPDSDTVTFSLEPPLVPGMSIDRQTGKITWIFPANQKGKIRFGAAVEDTDKTKVIKVFEVTVE